MHIDKRLYFRCVLDSIPFSLAGQMNSHIDYAAKITEGQSIQKLYIDPGNRLDIYPVAVNRGVVVFNDNLEHEVLIAAEDAYGNRKELQFRIRSVSPPYTERPEEVKSDSLVKLSYQRAGKLERAGIRCELPAGALYDDSNLRLSAKIVDTLRYSPLYRIGSETMPLKSAGKLSIVTNRVPRNMRPKIYVASLTYQGKHVACGGKYKDGSIHTSLKSFGRYFLLADTVPPLIRPEEFNSGDTCIAGQKIAFLTTDEGSGISRFAGFVDGGWALFEYDGKNDLLFYCPDDKRLTKGKEHSLSLHVTDDRGNTTRFKGTFYY
jgi:hypothetical protein